MSNRSVNLLIDDRAVCPDEKTADAVARNFEIIGEAANRLPAEFKTQYPNIDWDR